MAYIHLAGGYTIRVAAGSKDVVRRLTQHLNDGTDFAPYETVSIYHGALSHVTVAISPRNVVAISDEGLPTVD